METKRYIMIMVLFFSLCCGEMMADGGPLRVKRLQHKGFEISKVIEGQEVVLGYSETGNYDEAIRQNDVFKATIDLFSRQDHLKAYPLMLDASLPSAVQPLCTDLWHQFAPYYNMTPIIDSTHCATGCVAHAMAQVMYYYKYPERGNGSFFYWDILGCGDSLSADFSQHVYEWDYILDSYREGYYTERQSNAVAQLLSDCGISVRMRYGVASSGANSAYQPLALSEYFGYDKGMAMIYRDFYSHQELHDILHKELAAGRPILVSGWTTSSGHAFVLDGYDENGLYHVMWGLGDGECDGYYNIDYMSADQPQWYHHPDNPENGQNILQSFCIGVQPASYVSNTKETHVFAFANIALIEKANRTMSVAAYNLCNVGWNELDGRVALALKRGYDDVVTILQDYTRRFDLEEFTDTSYTDTLTFTIPAEVKDGTYRIVPVFFDNGEWVEARTMKGVPNYLSITLEGNNVTENELKPASQHLVMDRIEFPDTVYQWIRHPFSLSIRNDGDDEYCGRIYLAMVRDDKPETNLVFSSIGTYIPQNGSFSHNYNLTQITAPAGTYRLRVFNDVDLFTDSICVIYESEPITILPYASGIEDMEIQPSSISDNKVYDLSGRQIKKILPNQIIITTDGKKRSIQNVP